MFGLTKRIAMIVLGVWLTATGLFALANIGLPHQRLVLDLLAVAAGVLTLLQGRTWSANVGMMVLGAWLVARGLLGVLPVGIQGIGLVLNLAAVVAGVLILLKR